MSLFMLMLTTDASLEEVVKVLDGHLSNNGYSKIESIEQNGHAYSSEFYVMEIFPVDEHSKGYYSELFGDKFIKDPITEMYGECLSGLFGNSEKKLKKDFMIFKNLMARNKYSAHVWDYEEE